MSNLLFIVPTVFVNQRSNKSHYGYRAFDDQISVYENNWDSIPEDDKAFLANVVADCNEGIAHDHLISALDHVIRNKQPIQIDENIYQYEDIKDILAKLDGDSE